jgi:hypothetical protein
MRNVMKSLLVVLMIGIMIATAQPTVQRTYLPLIQQPATSRLVTLMDSDVGFVTATLLPDTDRVFVAYTDRRNGNRLHVAEHIGDRLIELDDPALAPMVLPDVSKPAFTFPGPKQGAAALVVVGTELRVYATSRDVGDLQGPFKLKVLVMPVPLQPQSTVRR